MITRTLSVLLLAAATPVLCGAALLSNDVELDDAIIRIEINGTDGDAGIQIFLDGEDWKKMKIIDPDGNRILVMSAKNSVREQGLTELFFESAEPSFDEQSLEELLELFPEGEYRFRGRTTDGQKLVGTAELTHALPDTPILVWPQPGAHVFHHDATLWWLPVADPPGSEIVGYEVIVEDLDSERTLSIHLPGDAWMCDLPNQFMAPGRDYKFEVLAIEESGNQTIAESSFATLP